MIVYCLCTQWPLQRTNREQRGIDISWSPDTIPKQNLAIITFFRGENRGVRAGNRGVSKNDLFHISSHGCPFHSCCCIGKHLHILQWVSLVDLNAGKKISVFLRMVLFFPLTYHLHHPVSVPKLWPQGEQESLLASDLQWKGKEVKREDFNVIIVGSGIGGICLGKKLIDLGVRSVLRGRSG